MFNPLIFLILTTLSLQDAMGADMVITNGKVYTGDSHNHFVEAVAIKGTIIEATGSSKDINTLITPSTTVIDAKKRLVLPGFNDAHLHFLGGGTSLTELDLAGCRSIEEIQNRLRTAIQQRDPEEWITGRGWDHTLFNSGQWPTKEMLDAVSPRNPVFVRRIDGHIGWANSLALKKAHISASTPNPEGGDIVHDPASAEPSGILKESAMNLVNQIVPKMSKEEMQRALNTALEHAAQLGVTSIQDNSEEAVFELYRELYDSGRLTVRVSEWLDFELVQNPVGLLEKIESLEKFTQPDFIRIGLLKGFVDGTLGSRTAYFFQPYNDDPTTVGIPQYTEAELQALVAAADSLGLQVGLHCIGAKANWMALKAYKTAQNKNKSRGLRHRIEHAQVLRLKDIDKFADYDIIASMQPTHCTSDLRWAEKRIGHERSKGAYAWRRILETGGKIAFGTDWPVEPLDPMRGIYSAVTRKNIDSGLPESGWFPDQCLSVKEAIDCYTMGSAFGEFQEDKKGSISAGKLADIVILSKDIFAIEPEEILTTKVDMTIFNGSVIYNRAQH